MSDAPDGSGPIQRRTPRTTDGGAPVSGALAIVLAVIAVTAGFLILKSISGDDKQQFDLNASAAGSGTEPDSSTGSTAPATPASSLPTVVTEPPLVTTGAKVIVANASGIGGSAGQMTTALQIVGFEMGDATNQAGGLDTLAVTQVLYDATQPLAEPVAQSVARTLGGDVSVTALTSTPPVQSGSLDGAGVLVMLGTDKAGKALADLNPTASTQPSVITNPQLAPGTDAPAG
jgi:hypothetical protein